MVCDFDFVLLSGQIVQSCDNSTTLPITPEPITTHHAGKTKNREPERRKNRLTMGNLLTCVHRPNSGGDPWRQTPHSNNYSVTNLNWDGRPACKGTLVLEENAICFYGRGQDPIKFELRVLRRY